MIVRGSFSKKKFMRGFKVDGFGRTKIEKTSGGYNKGFGPKPR
jgi:hypothetical protein